MLFVRHKRFQMMYLRESHAAQQNSDKMSKAANRARARLAVSPLTHS